jgi:hypothetical protein
VEKVLAPSERAVVDVLFDEPGQVTLEHHHPDRTYSLAAAAARLPPDDARHRRHVVTRAARTRIARPNRDMSSSVNRRRQ